MSSAPSSPHVSGRALRAGLLLTLLALAACGGGPGRSSSGPENGGGGNGGGGNGGGGNGGGNGGAGTASFRRLWVPNYNAGELRGYDGARTLQDSEAVADVVITLPPDTHPNALAFAGQGELWVTDDTGDRLLEFTPMQLQATGSPAPAVTITSDGASLKRPIGMAFDGAGNLWVAAAARLEMYRPIDLDESGPTTPARILTSGLDLPAGLVFDAAGNLWLTNASFTRARNAVLVFAPADLAAGGERSPILRLISPSFALVEGIAFDARGDLWVANNDGLSVVRLSASRLTLPMAPDSRPVTPDASLEADADDSSTGRSVRKPGGLVFDRDGNLFVNSQRGSLGSDVSAVVRFTPAQLGGTGETPPASVVLARTSSNPGYGGLALQAD